MDWRETVLGQHPFHAVVTRRWILPNETITALSKVCARDFRGPETVSEIADRTEEWMLAYALDIYHVISRFDEEKRVRKLCAHLSRGVVKKVRSAAWQKQIRNQYVEKAECALIIAEHALGDISKFKKATGKERKKLLALDGTTADDVDRLERTADARHSRLCRMLADAVWNLEEHCEYLREAVVWSDGLVERGDSGDDDGKEEEEEVQNSSKVTVYLPPPVRRSSRQSI